MILSTSECLDRYGSYYAMRRKISVGDLYKLESGIYSDTDEYVSGEQIIQKKFPSAVFTLESAFLYHGLTDVVPDEYSLATAARTSAITDRRVKHYYVPAATADIGKTTMEYAGSTITIYDKERLLIELMRYRRKLPYDYYKEVLSNYRGNLDQLYPSKIDEYLAAFPKRDAISRQLDLEVF